MIDRGEAYRQMYGTVSKPWEGAYPNPSSARERTAMEYAMIRRKGQPSHEKERWGNYSFYGYSNGKAQAFFPAKTSSQQILEIYEARARQATFEKFKASGEDVLKATGLASEIKLKIEDKNSPFVPELLRNGQIAELMAKKASLQSMTSVSGSAGGINKTLQEIMALSEADEQAAIAKISGLGNSLKRYQEGLQDIINVAANIDASVGELVVKHQESRIPDAIRLDTRSYTSALNILEQIDYVKRITDQIEKDSQKMPNFGLTGNVAEYGRGATVNKGNEMDLMKWSSAKGVYSRGKRAEQAIETLTGNLTGSMTNYLGGVYEIAIAATLKSSFEDIFEDVKITGANTNTAGGPGTGKTTVALTTSPLGRQLMNKTSKTDIQATLRQIGDRASLEMNFSAKNQNFSQSGKTTKSLDTSLDFVLDAILTSNSHESTMRAAFTNEKLYWATTGMNTFIGALMADIAIAGLPGDRIDFMVYANAVIPIADYFEVIDNVSFSGGDRSGRAAAASVLDSGTTAISFRTKTRGL